MQLDALQLCESDPPIHDAELALRVWLRWGDARLKRLTGPFALALIDRKNPQHPRICLYREPLGRRAWYYSSSSDYLLVADEPYALLAHPAVSKQPDDTWLAGHFALSRPSDNRTPFCEIRKLLPGEYLICTRDTLTIHRDPLNLGQRPLHYRRETDYAEHFRALLNQAVARCLHDPGQRVGIMLSGGMDSGPLAALAQRQLHDEGRTLSAYSWSLPDYPRADESAAITECTRHVGCELNLLSGMHEWPMRDLSTWPVNANSPLANCFRRLKLMIYRAAAADGCRVILNGAAGDSIYPNSSYTLLESWLNGQYKTLLLVIARLAMQGHILGLWRDPSVRRLGKHWLGWADRPTKPPVWLSAEARQHWQAVNNPWPPEAKDHPRPDQFQAALGQWAADGISEEAFFTRRCGIERREPFYDADLIDFMLSVPSEFCDRNNLTKWLAREAMKGLLPESIRLRPRSGLLNEFFDVGYIRQLSHFKSILTSPDAAWPVYVDHTWITQALHASSPTDREKLLIWYCVSFELWRQALSGDHPDLLHFSGASC